MCFSFVAKRHRGKQVAHVNEEWHFQEVAKEKYAMTRVCLTMTVFYALLHLK